MGLYKGIPKKLKRRAKNANTLSCFRCGGPMSSTDAVVLQVDSPGWHSTRTFLHPECKDMPHPSARPVRSRSLRSPRVIQEEVISHKTFTDSITNTAAVFAITGSTSATVAQLGSNGNITVTGTGFTSSCYGFVGHNSTQPRQRVTTVGSTTSLTMALEASDYARAGTLRVGVIKYPSSTSGYRAALTTISLTVT